MRGFCAALATITLVAGCTSTDPVAIPSAPGPAPTTQVPGPDSTASSAGSRSTPRSIRCETYESYAVQPIERSADDITVGPLTWPGLRKWATGDPSRYGSPAAGEFKIGAEVARGATVTVAVAPEASAHAGLRYGQRWGYTPAQAVSFHACEDGDTAFIGGFYVKGKRCVPLDVRIGEEPPTRIVVSFFNGACPVHG